MGFIKLQLGCLAVVFFIVFNYLKEQQQDGIDIKKPAFSFFTAIYLNAIVWLVFDGLTAYTVNRLDCVKRSTNLILHLCFLISIDTMVFLMFLYILHITESFPSKKWVWVLVCLPFAVSIIVLFTSFNSLEFVQGRHTNYSKGTAAYTCYAIGALYFVLTFVMFFRKWKFIERHKRMTIFVYMAVSLCVMVSQMIFPEILITAIAPTIFVLGLYLNHEEPSVKKLVQFNRNTVMDFATLVENRDNNTGGHIKRTTAYVKLLLQELKARGHYKNLLTKDYINNMENAAPMHDIGKIATPDAILQKPGKLTDEEYSIMKEHSQNGANIIQETFGKHSSSEFIQTAYKVALHHHEKWNGRGYPAGLSGTDIPLEARIMAVADVFDAVSQKRCYREAMPLDECFEIIRKGKEQDFDPLLVDIFLDIRPLVEDVYRSI